MTNKMTFAELFEAWLEAERGSLASAVCELYGFYFRQFAQDRFGQRRVDEITAKEWAELEAALPEQPGANGKPITAARARQAAGMFREVFRYGKTHFGLKDPLQEEFLSKECSSGEPEVFTREDVEKMRAAAQPFDIYHICIMLCLFSGTTHAEICGVRWGDINADSRLMNIKSGTSDKGKAAPARALPIPDWISDQLAIMKRSHRADRLILEEPFEGVKPARLRTRYESFLKKAGVEYKSMTALRNTFAVRSIEDGISAERLSELLGHSDVYVTYRQFGKVFERVKNERRR